MERWLRRIALVALLCVAAPASAQYSVTMTGRFPFPVQGSKFVPQADVSVSTAVNTLVAAANSNRAALYCTNTDIASVIGLGDSGVGTNGNRRLQPNEMVRIGSTSDIWGITIGAGAATLACTEEIGRSITIPGPPRYVTGFKVLNIASTFTILAANASRVKAECVNIGAGLVRIGDSTVTGTQGVRLQVGSTLTLYTTSSIHARREAGISAVGCVEETQ